MDILPVNNLTRIVEHARHDEREQPQKRPQQRKKEKFATVPVYTLNGGIQEEPPPKIDVLV
jgi:hypothetical protein